MSTHPPVYLLLRKNHIGDGEHEPMELLGIYTSLSKLAKVLPDVRRRHNENYLDEEFFAEEGKDAYALNEAFEDGKNYGDGWGYYVLEEHLNHLPKERKVLNLQAIFFDPQRRKDEFAFAGTMTALEVWMGKHTSYVPPVQSE